MSNQTKDQDIDRVRKAMNELGEHFDTVQVFVSRHDPGDDKHTLTIQLGSGHWYARYGQIQSWLVKCDEDTRAEARKAAAEDDDKE